MAQHTCTIRHVRGRVVVLHAGRGISLSYGAALAMYHDLKRLCAAARQYDQTDTNPAGDDYVFVTPQATLRRVGLSILFELAGRLWFDLEYGPALQIAGAIYTKAREAEGEQPKVAARQIRDQALLLETGAPFGITDDPRKIREAVKLAGAIPPRAVFGTPSVISRPPAQRKILT